jgi:hypothetical protein
VLSGIRPLCRALGRLNRPIPGNRNYAPPCLLIATAKWCFRRPKAVQSVQICSQGAVHPQARRGQRTARLPGAREVRTVARRAAGEPEGVICVRLPHRRQSERAALRPLGASRRVEAEVITEVRRRLLSREFDRAVVGPRTRGNCAESRIDGGPIVDRHCSNNRQGVLHSSEITTAALRVDVELSFL